MRKHYTEEYEALFDHQVEPGSDPAHQVSMDEYLEEKRASHLIGYRAKTIVCGEMTEVEIFPILSVPGGKRQSKARATSAAQERVNRRHAEKKFIRIVNCNFTKKDLAITLTYAGDAPTLEQAQKDVQKYVRRINAWRKRRGWPSAKYVYVIEYEDETGGDGNRIHVHIIMSAMDRDAAEGLWGAGRVNVRRLQPDEYGLEAIGKYMLKAPKGKKRWGYSKGLKKPKVTVAEKKFTRRAVEQMVMDFERAPKEVLTRLYKGHDFLDCVIYTSDWIPGAFIYAKLRRRGKDERDRRPRRTE
ncbi:MAG: hypothetical protein LBD02_10690 [Christensenellaceae bacterium]|jgi:hypothetical protein|nr:hypothetical protein [Christensenellaceae bacterium]